MNTIIRGIEKIKYDCPNCNEGSFDNQPFYRDDLDERMCGMCYNKRVISITYHVQEVPDGCHNCTHQNGWHLEGWWGYCAKGIVMPNRYSCSSEWHMALHDLPSVNEFGKCEHYNKEPQNDK